jgi:5'-methylthioadenosine phosphorylase
MENPKISFIGGGNLYGLSFFKNFELKTAQTEYGPCFYYLIENCPLILRHGVPKNIPPHQINYRANIKALKNLGVRYIFSFNSVGSCKKNIKPGEFLVPDDYIGFEGTTFYNQETKYITPELSVEVRKNMIEVLKKLGFKFKAKGIYFQTPGPRYETKAEIKLIKKFGDVVGMTMANEATLSKELGLEYGSICSIDNWAHGATKIPLTQEMVDNHEKQIKDKIKKIIEKILQIKQI